MTKIKMTGLPAPLIEVSQGRHFLFELIFLLKPPTTYSQQLNKLKEHGFIIEDNEKTLEFLNNINYYRLSAYFLPFQHSEDKIVKGISFSRIISIYRFDSQIRLWITALIEDIEQYAKTQIAYYIAHKYGAEAYIDEKIFSNKTSYTKFCEILERSKKENRRNPVILHHQNKYEGHMPIWAAVEFFSLGVLSRFYSNLKTCDKKRIARDFFNTGHKQLESWLHVLTDLRNKCAHFTRLYYWDFISIPKNDNKKRWKMDKSLFSQIFMLKLLHPNKSRWNKHLNSFHCLINDFINEIDLNHIGFKNNWNLLLQ